MELKDKVVIVTGAAQGLGRQFALDCAANGMKVALADIDLDALEKNIRTMGDFARSHGVRHRVHGKMHKSVDIAKLQEHEFTLCGAQENPVIGRKVNAGRAIEHFLIG